ncbi:envelope stress response protein PspG [Musicola paradisiaca]|uniref:Phage shock protein G n=1 Tax=Musicola paradisiaca (strain Ech703) TaxID=579405 RepID=C6CA79_MUSP7|nr:envelope stress response protein PspG [Musicola paradisiaca]ACS84554.1 phage shock protein G [Musicola paradisiaca Ech703]
MFEILFVIGFFVVLVITGISLLGVMVALAIATAAMLLGGFVALVFKLLPWLLLALAVAWIWRATQQPTDRYHR